MDTPKPVTKSLVQMDAKLIRDHLRWLERKAADGDWEQVADLWNDIQGLASGNVARLVETGQICE